MLVQAPIFIGFFSSLTSLAQAKVRQSYQGSVMLPAWMCYVLIPDQPGWSMAGATVSGRPAALLEENLVVCA